MKSLIHKIIICFFFLWYSFTAYNQNTRIDSLQEILQSQKEDTGKVNTLNTIVAALLEIDSAAFAAPYANQTKSLAEKINYDNGKALAYYNLTRIYLSQEKYTEAMNSCISALEINIKLKNKQTTAEMYNVMGYIYTRQWNFPEALKKLYNSLKIYEDLKDTGSIASLLINIATINRSQDNNTEALNNFLTSLKLYQSTGNMEGIANCYQGIAYIYIAENRFEEALKKDSAALAIFRQLNDSWSAAWCLSSIGKIFEAQGSNALSTGDSALAEMKFSDALQNYLTSLQIFKSIQSKNDISKLLTKLGNINLRLKKFKEAKNYFESAMKLSNQSNDLETLKYAHEGLSRLDSIDGNYKTAYEHYKMFILYRDKLADEEGKKKSLQTMMTYAFDKKEAMAKAEQDQKDEQTKRTRNLQYIAIGAILLVALFLYLNNRLKQKAKIKIEKAYSELKSTQAQLIQSEKMASLGELTAGIAHEIQNPLNFVNNFSDVSSELIDEMNEEIAKGNLEDVKQIAEDLKQNLEKINHHGKRAGDIVKGMLQHSRSSSGVKEPTNINALADEYLRLAYHGLRAKDKSFNATMKTDFDETIGNINIIPQDIGRVILNLITNAFYAAPLPPEGGFKDPTYKHEPTVWINTKKVGDKILISVKDNGPGIPQKILDKIFQPFFTTKPTGQGTGLGLSLSYDIVKAHGGEIRVETKDGEGTEFIIELPIV